MSLIQQLQADFKAARIDRNDRIKIDLLSVVLSRANTDAKNDLREANDADVLNSVKYYSKGANETVSLMAKSGMTSDERYIQAQREVEILGAYLPKQLSAERLEEAAKEAIAAAGPNFKPGMIIGALKKLHGDTVDARLAGEIIARLIAG